MSAHIGVLAVLLLVLMVPGLAIGLAAGLRGWLLAAGAPVLTFGVIALTGSFVPKVLGGWSPWTFALVTAVIAAVVFLVRLVSRRWYGSLRLETGAKTPWTPVQHVGIALAVLAATALGLYVTKNATGGFNQVHQFWDAMFHANGIRYIADSGASAPGDLRFVNDPNNPNFFYPNAFHVLLATSVQITGAGVMPTINLWMGLLAGVFSLGLVGVLRVVNARPALAGSVAVLAGTFTTYPYALEFFGPVWPFASGVAVIPAFLALLVEAVTVRHPALVVLGALGMVGLVTIHPSVALSATIVGFFFVVQRWVVARKIAVKDLVALLVMAVLASLVAVPQLLGAAATATFSAVDWPIYATPGSALGQLFFLNFESARPQWWLVVALVLGLIGLRRLKDLTWWFVGGGVFMVLFVMTTSYKGKLVALLTGPWWNDRWRFIALCTLPLVVLAGNGLVVARDGLLKLAARVKLGDTQWSRIGSSAVVVLVLTLVSSGLYVNRNIVYILGAYNGLSTMTPAKEAAMDELGKLVPKGDLVMNDPGDGSAWMWALEDVQPVFGHVITGTPDEKGVGKERVLLFSHFDELDTNEEVRRTVTNLKITYVFHSDEKVYGSSTIAAGTDKLDGVRSLKLVYSQGGSKIYRVDLSATG
ncbi:MAG: hypothetical protein QOF58_4128 [Pseudonocardiales bacterium]|nr:hypothetical protein [Pseudonocardiales bacterium]